jgi:SOS response regulatory protein OraA/RecX
VAAVGRFFGKFFGRTIGDAASFAIGGSISRTIDPELQEVANESWRVAVASGATRPLSAGEAGEIVAEDVELLEWGADQAAQEGIGGAQFAALVQAILNAPGVPELIDLRRRGRISRTEFLHGLRKAKLETRWDGPLEALLDQVYSVADLANGIQQGFVPSAGILPDTPDVGTATIRQNPPLNIDPAAEAAKSGVTLDQLTLMADLVGLPPGPELLQSWVRRGVISEQDLVNGIRQGHTKTEWAQAYLDTLEQVLHATDYAGLRLRGWITPKESYDGGALTGYTPEQMDLLYLNRGRPATTHQVWIGLKRGGKYIGENLSERETFDRAIRQSDLRPEWSDLLWAQRYSYPSAFALRGLVQSKAISAADGTQILEYEGWEPTLAAKVATAWAAGGASAEKDASATDLLTDYEGYMISEAELRRRLRALGYADDELQAKIDLSDARRVRKYRDAVVSKAHTQYVKGRVSRAEAAAALSDVKVTRKATEQILALWDIDKDLEAVRLTAAEVRAEYTRGTLGLEAAVAQLVDRGYSDADARAYLGLTAPRLTAPQVIAAVRSHAVTEAEGLSQLQGLGYSTVDAQELLASQITELTSKQILAAVASGQITADEGLQRLLGLGYRDVDARLLLASL